MLAYSRAGGEPLEPRAFSLPDLDHVPVPALPALPPRSATEIVDGAVQLIRLEFGYFLRIATIGAIPSLIQAVVTLLLFPTLPTDPVAVLRQQAALLPLTLLTYAFATMQSGAIVGSALALLRGDPLPTVWDAFLGALRRIFALLGANLLLVAVLVVVALPLILIAAFVVASSGTTLAPVGMSGHGGAVIAVLIAVALLALVLLAGVTIFARSAIMTALVMAEGLGPIAALRRSHSLSRGNYLRLARTYGLVLLIVFVVYAVLLMLATLFPTQQQALQTLVSVLLIPVVPIIGSIMLLTYADLRVRREGADLDAALDALSA